MTCDLAIKGGLAALEGGPARADIFVSRGVIRRITRPSGGNPAAVRVIDASGLVILPGLIDAHVHYNLRLGGRKTTADDFNSGSAAAACGGVTTVIDFTGQGAGVPLEKGFRARLAEAEGRMHVDYGLHAMVPAWGELSDPGRQMKRLMTLGVTSFKFFTAYEKRGLMSSDSELLEALEFSRRSGALICVHAESGGLIDILTDELGRRKFRGAEVHRLSRPDFTEWEAVTRVLSLAGQAGGRVYFVHLSSGVSARLVALARARGIKALGETCPQYLTLDESLFRRADGHLWATCPPVRTVKDSAALWAELGKGGLSVVATDSCAFTRRQKDSWKGDISRLPMGIPGTQTMLPLVYTFGVKRGLISLGRMAQLLSSGPAKIMGLYPRKGVIRPGADADLTLMDPVGARKVDFRKLKHNTDYSPYQGLKLSGWAVKTILRGEVIAENGDLCAPARPQGRFLKRGPSMLPGQG